MGVENSSSVLAAASIELSHKTSAKLLSAIHCVRAETYAALEDLYTGARCWITVRVPLEKTARYKNVSQEVGSEERRCRIAYLRARSSSRHCRYLRAQRRGSRTQGRAAQLSPA